MTTHQDGRSSAYDQNGLSVSSRTGGFLGGLRACFFPPEDSIEPTLASIFLFPVSRWRVVLVCMVLGLVIGFIIPSVQTPKYVATLTLVPNIDDQLNFLDNMPGLSSLSSLAGGGGLLSKPERVTPFQQFQAVMTSPEVAVEMERRGHYLEKLFPKRWDARNKVWLPRQSDMFLSIKDLVKRALRLPVHPHPVPEDLERIISWKVDASEAEKTSVFYISYANRNRNLALSFVKDLYYSTELALLRRERKVADARVLAAQQQLDGTTAESSRQALMKALTQFNIKAIQAEVGPPYAARIISGPDALDIPTSPSVIWGMIFGLLGGLLLSVFTLIGTALYAASNETVEQAM
jgi:hypothetical protein